MKVYLIIMISSVVLLSCYTGSRNNENIDFDNSITEQSTKNYKGFVRVDLDNIYLNSDSLDIYNEDHSIHSRIRGKMLYVDGKQFNLMEDRKDTIRNYIKSYSFDPDYRVFILESADSLDGFFKVEMNGGYKLVPAKNRNVKFETLEEFVLSSMPNLRESTPLRTAPEESASIVQNFEDYYYLSIRIEGDWLYLECDVEFNECPKNADKGWVKWRDETGVLIRLAQTY